MAIRDSIKFYVEAQPPPILPVPTPELPDLDGQICVTRISPRALADLYDDEDAAENGDLKADFVRRTACDAEGTLIFQPEDVLFLSTSKYLTPMVERLHAAGLEFSGLTQANRESWRKNSKTTADAGSPSS